MWQSLDAQMPQHAQRINNIARQIAELNGRIVEAESSGAGRMLANDLRDQRGELLRELSRIIAVSVQEDPRGGVVVSAGGRPIVFLGHYYTVTAERSPANGGYKLVFSEDGAEVSVAGGTVAGIYEARDEVLHRYAKWFDDFAASLVWQVNRIHSTGAGLEPRRVMQGTNRMADPSAAINSLDFGADPRGGVFTAANGRITVDVVEDATGIIHRYALNYDADDPLSGTPDAFVERLDALAGISASIDNLGRVVVRSDAGFGFFFSEDTGGVLALLGLGGLFAGYDADTIDVSPDLEGHPEFMAAGRTLLPGDNEVMLQLAALDNNGLFLNTSLSLNAAYQALVGTLGSDALSVQDAYRNQSDIVLSLENERQEVSGVSLDEELAELIQYQRAYQGMAKFISIVDELLDTLIRM